MSACLTSVENPPPHPDAADWWDFYYKIVDHGDLSRETIIELLQFAARLSRDKMDLEYELKELKGDR